MKSFVRLILSLVIVAGLLSVSGCMGNREESPDELMKANWIIVEVTSDSFQLPDNFKDKNELFLFMSRSMIEVNYDLSRVTLGEVPLTEIDSTFNLTSSDFQALFLVGKFDLKNANLDSATLTIPNFQKHCVAVAYKEEK